MVLHLFSRCQPTHTADLSSFNGNSLRCSGARRIDLVDGRITLGCRYSQINIAIFGIRRVAETGNQISLRQAGYISQLLVACLEDGQLIRP